MIIMYITNFALYSYLFTSFLMAKSELYTLSTSPLLMWANNEGTNSGHLTLFLI